jgi:hypothetical protein
MKLGITFYKFTPISLYRHIREIFFENTLFYYQSPKNTNFRKYKFVFLNTIYVEKYKFCINNTVELLLGSPKTHWPKVLMKISQFAS